MYERERERIKKYLINSKDHREVDTNLKQLKIEDKFRDTVINEYWKQCDIIYHHSMTKWREDKNFTIAKKR